MALPRHRWQCVVAASELAVRSDVFLLLFFADVLLRTVMRANAYSKLENTAVQSYFPKWKTQMRNHVFQLGKHTAERRRFSKWKKHGCAIMLIPTWKSMAQ